MNVCQIISHYVPAYEFGGPLRVAHGLSRALLQQGHSVKVCTTNLKNSNENLDISVDMTVLQNGVETFYEPTFISRYWGFSPKLYHRTWKLAGWADIFLVHFHYQFANWVGAYIARCQNKPYVLFSHGSFNEYGIKSKHKLAKEAYLRLIERRNIAEALFIAFNSPEEQELSRSAKSGVVIPNGIDPSELHIQLPRGYWLNKRPKLVDKICFLYLGRLNFRQKGLDVLLPAFSNVVQKRENVHLILAGPDERGGEAKIREMITSLKIDKHVTLTGIVSGDEKLAILQDSDVFILVSPSEGTSIALLEAMFMKLPVVVSDRVGLADRIQSEHCGLVIQRDVSHITNALLRMVDHSKERRLMGNNASQLVDSEYTWEVISEKLIRQIKPRITYSN